MKTAPERTIITHESRSLSTHVADPRGVDHLWEPATDAEAKQIIRELNHYAWDTHKISGRFDRRPYILTATIAGSRHAIRLGTRFGTVLKWLDAEERRLAARTKGKRGCESSCFAS